MADVSFTIGMDLRTNYVSPSIERILGYTPAERLSQPVNVQITPRSLRLASETLTAELTLEQDGGAEPDRSRTMILEYYQKDGSIRCLETYIRNDKGALTGFYGLSRDIAERHRMEEALRVSEKRYNIPLDKENQPPYSSGHRTQPVVEFPALRPGSPGNDLFFFRRIPQSRPLGGFEVSCPAKEPPCLGLSGSVLMAEKDVDPFASSRFAMSETG